MINNLDMNQMEAVHTNFKNVMICAPPGSGKTTVIINRIYYLTNVINIDTKNIVVITFTRASAIDMKCRYLSIIDTNSIPFFGTFHSLFYNILKKYKGKISIVESFKAHNLVRNVLMSYLDSIGDEKVKEVLNDISLLKNTGESIESFNSKIDKQVFINCFREYEDYKLRNDLMDFDDLQLEVKNILETDKNILKYYRDLFKYILVDEFQDCDKLQIDILKLIGRNGSIFAVGDEDQCIYGFRGSDPGCMVNFDEYFSGGKKLFLKINYRSVSNIVKISQRVICNNKNRNSKIIESNKLHRGDINFKIFEREKEQAYYVSNSIKELIEKGKYQYKNIAVLYRTNIESRSLIDNLLKYNIKFKLLDGQYNFYNHFICRDLIAYLKLAVDMCHKGSFIRIVNKPFRYIGKMNIEKVRNNGIRENCFEILKNIEGIPIFQIKAIDRLQGNIKKLNKMKAEKRIEFILDKLEYMDYLHMYCKKLNTDMEEFKHIIHEFKEACEDFSSIDLFLEHIKNTEESLNKNLDEENAVILSTIHGVKGMEFENVFIINCSEGLIPHSNSILNNLEEERRLFYVGITRAIDNLYLCFSRTIKGKAVEVSRFIRECNLQSSEDFQPEFSLKVGDCVAHKVFGQGKITGKKNEYINVLFLDNIERRFYNSVFYSGQLSIEKK